MTTAAEVIACARLYIGVRYQHQGRNRAGLDCLGLVVRVCHDLGLSSFDSRAYGRLPNGDQMRAALREQCTEVDGEPRLGLVALMRFATEPQHVGLVGDHVGGVSLIHALAASRKVVEHRIDDAWRGRILGLYALPGVSD